MKRGFIAAFLIFPWLLLAGIAGWLCTPHRWADVAAAIRYRQADDFFRDGHRYENVTEAKIYRLEAKDEPKPVSHFSLSSETGTYSVSGKIRLTGAEAKEFLEIWNAQPVSFGRGGDCHDPPYGFRIFKGDTFVAEATICWTCENARLSDGGGAFGGNLIYSGFNAHHPAAQKLLEFCDRRLPYHRPAGKSETPE